jgi:Pyruvate/2-oxoacid:ferredoxin oxidoreductase gamma subunit
MAEAALTKAAEDRPELAVLITGIGGQGVQLAAHVLGRAAIAKGLDVQLFGSYEGMMRGGATQATLVLAAERVESPPTVHRADAAIVMHHEHSADVIGRVSPGGLILVNKETAHAERADCDVRDVPAADIAIDLGHVMAASMVMIGVLAGTTAMVERDQLAQAVEESLPSYRREHVARNVAAIEAGLAWATGQAVGTP